MGLKFALEWTSLNRYRVGLSQSGGIAYDGKSSSLCTNSIGLLSVLRRKLYKTNSRRAKLAKVSYK